MIRKLIALLGIGAVSGCSLWTPPPLDTSVEQRRTPQEDVRLLNELFTNEKTDLWGGTTGTIRWVETDVYRMFECENHYVIVYPPNWTKKRYSIMLLPGNIPDLPAKGYVVQQDRFVTAVGAGKQEWVPNQSIVDQRIGLEQAYLGMPFSDFKATFENNPEKVRSLYSPIGTYASGVPLEPNQSGYWIKGDLECNFTALGDRVFKLHYNRGDAPTLMRQRLAVYEASLVAEGEINLSEIR